MELLVCMLCSITCGALAKRKNRNVVYWSIGGLFGTVLAIMMLLALDDKSENKLDKKDNLIRWYKLKITPS